MSPLECVADDRVFNDVVAPCEGEKDDLLKVFQETTD